MRNEQAVWWGAMVLCIGVHLAALKLNMSIYVLPALVGLALLFLFERGERGAFPFRKRHIVEYRMNYFGFVILLAVIFNTTPRVLPSGDPAIQPYYWAIPMIAAYAFGLYRRRTEP